MDSVGTQRSLLRRLDALLTRSLAITGHRSVAMHYAKRAEKKRLARAAMDKWEAAEPENETGINQRLTD